MIEAPGEPRKRLIIFPHDSQSGRFLGPALMFYDRWFPHRRQSTHYQHGAGDRSTAVLVGGFVPALSVGGAAINMINGAVVEQVAEENHNGTLLAQDDGEQPVVSITIDGSCAAGFGFPGNVQHACRTSADKGGKRSGSFIECTDPDLKPVNFAVVA